MKLLYFVTILALLFGQPTIWPQSLDELFTLIDTGAGNWVFTAPCPDNPGVSLTWRDAKNLHAADEDALFYRGAVEYLFGDLQACKPDDDKVLFYGAALPELLLLVDTGG